jgi:hypothetical protein
MAKEPTYDIIVVKLQKDFTEVEEDRLDIRLVAWIRHRCIL